MFQKVFFGPLDKAKNGKLKDLSGRELGVFVPLVIAIFLMGLFPRPLLRYMEPSVLRFLTTYGARLAEPDGPPHLEGTAPTPAPGSPPTARRTDAPAHVAVAGGTP